MQQLMWQWFAEEGLVTDSAPERVGAGERRQPALPAHGRRASRPSGRNELLLLDLWGKLARPGAVFADITWVGFTGAPSRTEMARAFAADRAAPATRRWTLVQDAAARRDARSAASSWIGRRGR